MNVSIHNLRMYRNAIADWAIAKGAWTMPLRHIREAQDNQAAFRVLLENYGRASNMGFICPELDCLTRQQLSPWYVWLLETYCLGKGCDHIVQAVIELHKRVMAGEVIVESEWAAANALSWANARAAAWAHDSTAKNAAWAAASATATGVAEWANASSAAAAARDAASDAASAAAWAAARAAARDAARAAAWDALYNLIVSLPAASGSNTQPKCSPPKPSYPS